MKAGDFYASSGVGIEEVKFDAARGEGVEGPEECNWNYGIFRLDADHVEFCRDMNGKARMAPYYSLKSILSVC